MSFETDSKGTLLSTEVKGSGYRWRSNKWPEGGAKSGRPDELP
jgi:hypothetical protein